MRPFLAVDITQLLLQTWRMDILNRAQKYFLCKQSMEHLMCSLFPETSRLALSTKLWPLIRVCLANVRMNYIATRV